MDVTEAIARLRKRDISGLEMLVLEYQVQAVRAAYLITQDRPMAEDVVATAFLRAYERIGQFDTSRPFGPWFLRVVVNDAIKAVSRQRRHVSLHQTPVADEEPLADRSRAGWAGRSPLSVRSSLRWRRQGHRGR